MIQRLALFLALSAPAAAAEPLVEVGTYAMVVDVASRSRVPYAGTTEVVSRSLVRVELQRDPLGALIATQEVCDVKLLSDSRAETVLPDSFIRSLPRQRFPVHLSDAGAFRADPGPTFVGFDPVVTGGEVPRKASDAGVVDGDDDGRPGVTVHVVMPVFGAVKIYVAQLGHSRYVGTASEGGVSGRVEIVSLDQRTLGASFAPFAANPEITPVPEASRFRMWSDGAGRSCAELSSDWRGEYSAP